MGLGKSMLAIAIAMDTVEIKPVIILLTKSLQANMRKTIYKYIRLRTKYEPDYHLGALDPIALDLWIEKHFSFVSMNASNMLAQMSKATDSGLDEYDAVLEKRFGAVAKMPSLNGKTLIVDEAHNLFRAIVNGGKNAKGLYDQIIKALNLTLVFLTGTPIANDPFEVVPCFNMLCSRKDYPLLPENYVEFKRLYVDSVAGTIKNKEKFQNRIFGMVSFVDRLTEAGKAFGINDIASKAEFPEQLPTVIRYPHMAGEQYVRYQLAREREKEESSRGGSRGETPAMTKPKSSVSSTYRVRSRQFSNYASSVAASDIKDAPSLPDMEIISPKYDMMYADIEAHSGQIGLVYSQFTGIGGLGTFIRYLQLRGWTEYKLPAAPKRTKSTVVATKYVDNINKQLVINGGWQSSQIASGISDKLGENDDFSIHDALISGMKRGGATSSKVYAVITGEVDALDRERLQNISNQRENMHGEIISLMLISSTGAEGLDFKNLRYVQLMEPYWNMGRIGQVIARGVRSGSHYMLPADEKNVQPYMYLSIPPAEEAAPDGTYSPTTDVELYSEAMAAQKIIDSFVQAEHEVSIECLVNGEEYCRSCSPTDLPLFTNDPARDIRTADNCCQYTEETVRAEEFSYEGKTYYYRPDDTNLYDYAIFVHDAALNSYVPFDESNPLYEKIAEAINESRK